MQTHVALLRGVNVVGKVIPMANLKSLFEKELGFKNVATVIQSGNVIFQAPTADSMTLARAIEDRIHVAFGHDITVLLRNPQQLTAIVAANPYLEQDVDPKALHVTFLRQTVGADQLAKIPAAPYLPDRFQVQAREVYLHCPQGYGRTKLTNALFESRFGLKATTRNWATVMKLATLATARS